MVNTQEAPSRCAECSGCNHEPFPCVLRLDLEGVDFLRLGGQGAHSPSCNHLPSGGSCFFFVLMSDSISFSIFFRFFKVLTPVILFMY